MAGYDRYYHLRKAWALYPGIVQPVSGGFLAAHYARRRAARGPGRALADAITGVLFHLWIPWRAWRVQRRHGLDAGWRRRARAIAHRRFADPNDIALFGIRTAGELDFYIRRFEDAALNKRINPAGWTGACVLADKARFAERCAAAGLPHAETLAIARRGDVTLMGAPEGREIIAKPADGEGGDGVTLLGPVTDGATLARLLAAIRAPGTLVAQLRLACHPALADLALAALPTVRIVTILDEAGAPEVVSATFRCPSDPAAAVDNMKAGGLIAAVTLATGTLGVARRGYGGGDHAAHPVTRAAIAGRRLPDWDEACRLATRAHGAAFADYALIGWDVALTPDGPRLLEGNGKPGVLMPQRAAGEGLGAGRYGALLAFHLAKTA